MRGKAEREGVTRGSGFPKGVRGPVLLSALARFAAIRL